MKTPSGALEGAGKTLNISRSGVLFEPEHTIGVGAKIDMQVQMGDAVGGGAPITLRVSGVTLRSQQGYVAVAIKKYKLKADDDESA